MTHPDADVPDPSVWYESYRNDPLARAVADRHYNRQKVGAPGFVPPGRCVVFTTADVDALWVSSWPFAEYVRHAWPGAWVCSCFRNESPQLASVLIRSAIAATRFFWPGPPTLGMITFVDRRKVRPTMVRGQPVWGWTFRKAGFVPCGETRGGLLALQLLPAAMPAAIAPLWRLRA